MNGVVTLSDNFENEFENDDTQEQDLKTPKALRDAYDKQKAQNAALEKTIAELNGRGRVGGIADELSAKGLNPKVAKFIPADAVLDDWLKENGELFGVTVTEAPAEQTQEAVQAPAAPHPLQTQFANLANATEGASAPTGGVDSAKAQEALATGGLEAFENYLRSSGNSR
jgi:hypothetical protein